MNSPAPEVNERLSSGRRCFLLRSEADGQIASYGWVTRGKEHVGELERRFNMDDDEAYIWNCGTVPGYRRQSCYSALLSQLIYRLHEERTPRIWIGASRLNQPSVRGFANAGFSPVIDLSYRRLYRLTTMWLRGADSAGDGLVDAAFRIVLNDHERRIGPLAVGILPTIQSG
jgi:GNAT superfamily N-acetyltransferase